MSDHQSYENRLTFSQIFRTLIIILHQCVQLELRSRGKQSGHNNVIFLSDKGTHAAFPATIIVMSSEKLCFVHTVSTQIGKDNGGS